MSRPIFETPEELDRLVESYIESTDILTMTGLALALGFCNRASIYDYEKRPEYSHTIKRAKMIVEQSYELSLRTQYSSGSIFALKNMGWTDKQEVEQTTTIKNMPVEFVSASK